MTQKPLGASDASTPDTRVDLLVLHASDLISTDERVRMLRSIQALKPYAAPHLRGPWLLVMIRTHLEGEIAYRLTMTLTSWCQGVRSVKFLDLENTKQAALAFHRLHFPDIDEDKRSSYIMELPQVRQYA